MNRYAKVYGSIWSDERFSMLHTDTKLLYFYLISCKSCNSIGLFKLGKGTITDEFCTDIEGNETLTPQELDYIIEDLNHSGIATYKGRWVMFNNWMRWNLPSSPVHVPGLANEVNDLLPQKPPKEFLAHLLATMQTTLVGLSVKKDATKKTYYAIFKEHLNIKALSDFFGGEDNLAKAFSGKWSETPQNPTPRLPKDYLKTRYSLPNDYLMNKEEEEGEEKEEGEGEEKGMFSSPCKKGTEAEITLLCSDGRTRVVSPSAVLKVLSSNPSLDAETLRAKVQAKCLKGPQPNYDDVDQFFIDAVREVIA